MPQTLVFRDFHKAGLLPSANSMSVNGLAQMSACDPFSSRGQLKISPAMLVDNNSTAVVNAKINSFVYCTDGSLYGFGLGGTVYKRTGGGTWTLERTVIPAAGDDDILCAQEFNGYIYYATESRLGRWQIGTAWAGATDNWQTFANTDIFAHPMIVKLSYLYIGDGRAIHAVDRTGTYSANALQIETAQNIVCFADSERHIAIGTRNGLVSDPQGRAKVYVWDGYSIDVTSESLIQEPIVSAMGVLNGNIILFAGFQGKIYLLSGYRPQLYTQIPHTWYEFPIANKYIVPQGTITYRGGTIYFAPSEWTVGEGNLTMGVYALGQATPADPIILYQPFMPLEEDAQNISACISSSDTSFTAACYGGTNFVFSTNEASGTGAVLNDVDFVIKTPRITLERNRQQSIVGVDIAYSSIPSTWNITVNAHYTTSRDGSTYTGLSMVKDTDRKILHCDNIVADICDFYVEITASGSNDLANFLIDAIYITTE